MNTLGGPDGPLSAVLGLLFLLTAGGVVVLLAAGVQRLAEFHRAGRERLRRQRGA